MFTDVTKSKGFCTLTDENEKEQHKKARKLTFSLAQATMWSSPMSVRPCFDAKSHNTASVYLSKTMKKKNSEHEKQLYKPDPP